MTHTSPTRTSGFASDAAHASTASRQTRRGHQDPRPILDDLDRAREAYGLTDRTMTVLRGMLSWLQDGSTWMFAQNKKLILRCKRIPERSLSRHIGYLVKSGLVARNPSPNGKRHARKEGEEILYAFGYDMSPFFARAAEIRAKAEEVEAQAAAQAAQAKRARDRLARLRMALEDLDAEPDLTRELKKERRRTPCPAAQAELERQAVAALTQRGVAVDNLLEPISGAKKMAGNDSRFGRHQENPSCRTSSKSVSGPPAAIRSKREKTAREDGGEPSLDPVPDAAQTTPASLSDAPAPLDSPAPLDAPAPRDAPAPAAARSQITSRTLSSAAGAVPAPGDDPPPPRRSLPEAEAILAMLTRKLTSGARPGRRGFHAPASSEGRDDVTAVKPGPDPHCRAKAASEKPDMEGRSGLVVTEVPGVTGAPGAADPRQTAVPTRARAEARIQTFSRPHRRDALPDLQEVLAACPEALSVAGERPRSWSQLFEAAWRIGGFLNITERLLAEACAQMGREGLAITVFGLCERHAEIRNPAGYLRTLLSRQGFRPTDLLPQPLPRSAPC